MSRHNAIWMALTAVAISLICQRTFANDWHWFDRILLAFVVGAVYADITNTLDAVRRASWRKP